MPGWLINDVSLKVAETFVKRHFPTIAAEARIRMVRRLARIVKAGLRLHRIMQARTQRRLSPLGKKC